MKKALFAGIIFNFCFTHSFAQADTAIARLNNYRDQVIRVFNGCSSRDEQITIAIKAKDPGRVESGRTALLQCANDGIKTLDSMQSFNGDASLKFSAREALKFYKRMAEYDLPQVRDYFILEEKFLAAKKQFKSKPAKRISEAEIYAYNNEIKRYNEAVTRYTQLNTFITANRKLTLYNWNNSEKIFTKNHKPKS